MPAAEQEQSSASIPGNPEMLSDAPEELLCTRLDRLGEGIGKVVYASQHWVVKRERSASAIIALILIWKVLRRLVHLLPRRLGNRLLCRPSRLIRLARVLIQPFVLAVPRSVWLMTHAGELWRVHRTRDQRGERLARAHLAGTSLVPERVEFPPTRVRVNGWPGWLVVSEAAERAEQTLCQRLTALAHLERWDQVEEWLERLLDLRQAGWQRGLFSMDTHLKNFGVIGDRVVLVDTGGLTKRWSEIAQRLSSEQAAAEPHAQLGLERVLAPRPDIAERFNARWKDVVSRSGVLRNWPER
jgi:hypothetical protein